MLLWVGYPASASSVIAWLSRYQKYQCMGRAFGVLSSFWAILLQNFLYLFACLWLGFFLFFFLRGKLSFRAEVWHLCYTKNRSRTNTSVSCPKWVCVTHHSKKVRGEELFLQLYRWGNGMEQGRSSRSHWGLGAELEAEAGSFPSQYIK